MARVTMSPSHECRITHPLSLKNSLRALLKRRE